MFQQLSKALCLILLLCFVMSCSSKDPLANPSVGKPVSILDNLQQDAVLLDTYWQIYTPRKHSYLDPATKRRPVYKAPAKVDSPAKPEVSTPATPKNELVTSTKIPDIIPPADLKSEVKPPEGRTLYEPVPPTSLLQGQPLYGSKTPSPSAAGL